SVDAGRKRQQRLDGSRYVLVVVGGSRPGYGQWTGAHYFDVSHVGAVNGAGAICEGAYVDGRTRLADDGDFVRFAVAQFVGEVESAGGVDGQLFCAVVADDESGARQSGHRTADRERLFLASAGATRIRICGVFRICRRVFTAATARGEDER